MKKNFRKTPDQILNKVNSINNNNLIVSCLLTYSIDSIKNGELNHLNISLDNNGISFPQSIIPSESQGKHSYKNINGETIIRKDLPKETIFYSWEVPNWGDYSNGSHDIEVPREVYQRDFIPPHLVSINIECHSIPNLNQYNILFQLDEVLDKTSDDFEERLFDLINLLQENVYSCDVNPSTVTYQDYLKTIQLEWEILPPGERDTFIKRLSNSTTSSNENQIGVIEQRYNFLLSLNPVSLVVGKSGLQKYSGAKINENLIVFENIRYGNAIYIMYENWDILSQKSRTEIMSGHYGNNYDRVIHNEGWENKVQKIINEKINLVVV